MKISSNCIQKCNITDHKLIIKLVKNHSFAYFLRQSIKQLFIVFNDDLVKEHFVFAELYIDGFVEVVFQSIRSQMGNSNAILMGGVAVFKFDLFRIYSVHLLFLLLI